MGELIIRGGTVVDGTGAPSFVADIAVRDGIIAVVSPTDRTDQDRGGEGCAGDDIDDDVMVIDATGMLVTPGFVDIHTHYDGQATWDEVLDPTSGHGVTTVVMGNCGVGFAPVRPGREEWLVQLMEGVEDIPGTALHEGITWNWESFPEYLDVLGERVFSIDVAAYIAHGPLRAYVMGERGARNEPATPDDIAEMGRLVREALKSGAVGFSTSRTLNHKARDGEPVPGTFAAMDELDGIADAMLDVGHGIFEVAPQGLEFDPETLMTEVDWMAGLAKRTGMPVTFAMLQNDIDPDSWRRVFEVVDRTNADGANLRPQIAARPFGMMLGWGGYHFFSKRPTYVELAARLPHDELVNELMQPDVRAAILAEDDLPADPTQQFDGIGAFLLASLDKIFEMGSPPDYEPPPDKAITAIAAAQGVDPIGLAYDLMCADDGRAFLMFPLFNYAGGSQDAIYDMLCHPAAVSGLSDGGAHCRMICDASIPTYLLTHWTRDRSRGPKLGIEEAVRLQTSVTADLVGFTDRGRIAVGQRADLNVIDMDNLTLGFPHAADDLPAGGRRLLQEATGYVATIVAGEVTRRDGADTGARPGRLVRSK
jgi:N-acyl-D-amino-acid deacylase